MSKLAVSLLQLRCGVDKAANLRNTYQLIKRAATSDFQPKLVVLPECFNSPYGTQYFREYAETVPDGESLAMVAKAAKEFDVYIVAGSIPERDTSDNRLYNTCAVFDNRGEMLCKFRKIHLFDINVPGGIKFTESETLSPGNSLATFSMGEFKIGLGICYDVRFSELAHLYRYEHNCNVLIYPGAFNMTTGPLHWELVARMRAHDTQSYVLMCAPARDPNANYVAWSHSIAVNPWAKVIADAADGIDAIVNVTLEKTEIDTVRQSIPISMQRRTDIYSTSAAK